MIREFTILYVHQYREAAESCWYLEDFNYYLLLVSLDLSRLVATLNRLERSIELGSTSDYPTWEVIQRGNGHVSVSTDINDVIKVLPPKTAEEILARERERKAWTTLLMALLEDHLAKFHKITNAKEMWEAIKSRFGGNDESKKMQKYILKQQFEGFSVSNLEGLHKGYDRTKPGVDSLSFDDMYNNLRVFEPVVKGSTTSSSSTQNVAFVSKNTSSTNEVSTAYGAFSSSVIVKEPQERCNIKAFQDNISRKERTFMDHQVKKVEGHGDWDAPEYTDTAGSKEKKINLALDENLISNEFAVKLCLDYEVKKGNKVVKKELIVALRGELYFFKFIINPKEDDIEPEVILGRSFIRLVKGIVDFGNGMITLDGEELPPFVCKMGKSSRKKKRAIENLNLFYPDIGPSSSTGRHLTQEEAAEEALALRISQRFALLEEVRPVLETMAYNDKYKKVLDEIWKDKVELDGMIAEEEEKAIIKVIGEALKKEDNPGALIFPIRFEGKINENAFADTGSDINTMPYRIYEKLGREKIKKVNRGITIINHTQAEPMGILTNDLCQVGVTTIIAKFLILDIPIDQDAPIVVGQGILYTIGGIVNTPERPFLTFDGICHQTFCATRSDVLRTAQSDNDDEEEYEIKRNKFGAPIVWKKAISFLGLLPVPLQHVDWKPNYKGCYTNEEEAKGQWRTEIRLTDPYGNIYVQTMGGNDDEAGSQDPTALDNTKPWKRMGSDGEINEMLRIKLREAGSNEEIFTSMAWIRAFNINEPIYSELCHEFYSTYEFDEVCADDELQTKKIIKFRLGGRAQSLTLLEFSYRLGLYHAEELDEEGFDVYFQGGLRSDEHFNAQEYWLSISREENLSLSRSQASTIRSPVLRVIHKMIMYGLCQRTTRKARVLSNEDLYERMGSIEIRRGAIERMAYRQSYHWDRYARVFEQMAGVYSVPLQGAYNPPEYAQP
ncbi:ribonuclease H-like domain-containing protein [Tanacetum coccineum]|uniref:Ribonuclease H-like domain-containing protein n=1 Tax=Tanacetum coccineum TaxID=301880 RepID=A0ABQ5ERF7_9ASTR